MTAPTSVSLDPLDEKLGRVKFLPAPERHIEVATDVCVRCGIDRVCLTVCPAGNFRLDERTGEVSVATESCLECGACRIVCTEGALTWKWPRGGFGVCYTVG